MEREGGGVANRSRNKRRGATERGTERCNNFIIMTGRRLNDRGEEVFVAGRN